MRGFRAGPLVLLILALQCVSCTSAEPAGPPILLLGVDGLEWDVLLPMLEAGRLPHLAKMMQDGAYGELETFVPTASPVVWTTIVTGKRPREHGILHFARPTPSGPVLFNSTDRKTKALWNILSDYDRSVWSIGWWMTFPVESVNGLMVAQTNTLDQLDTRHGRQVWKGTLLEGVPGQVHPIERQNEMISILREVDAQLPALTAELFGAFPAPLAPLDERLWENCQWTFRADATYARIVRGLLAEGPPPDLTLLYLGGPDVVGHRFWRYLRPELFSDAPSADQLANFADLIPAYYGWVDRLLGELRGAYPPDTRVLLISDHGMHAVNRDHRFDPQSPPADINSGEHQDAPPGVFFAAGPDIEPMRAAAEGPLRRADLAPVGSVLDITPTLLAMLGIPRGADMPGRVLTSVLGAGWQREAESATLDSHDTADFLAARAALQAPDRAEDERLEQLRSLGYLD